MNIEFSSPAAYPELSMLYRSAAIVTRWRVMHTAIVIVCVVVRVCTRT